MKNNQTENNQTENNQTENNQTENINIYEMLVWYQDHFSFNICEDIFAHTQTDTHLEKRKRNTHTINIWNRFDQQCLRNILVFYTSLSEDNQLLLKNYFIKKILIKNNKIIIK